MPEHGIVAIIQSSLSYGIARGLNPTPMKGILISDQFRLRETKADVALRITPAMRNQKVHPPRKRETMKRRRPPKMKKVMRLVPHCLTICMLKKTSPLAESKPPAPKKRKTTTTGAPEEVGDDEEPEEASDDAGAAPGEDEEEEGDEEEDVEEEEPEETAKTSGPAAAAKKAKGGVVPKEVEVPAEGEEEEDE